MRDLSTLLGRSYLQRCSILPQCWLEAIVFMYRVSCGLARSAAKVDLKQNRLLMLGY